MAKKKIIFLAALLILLVLILILRKPIHRKAKVAPTPETPSVAEEEKVPPTPEEAFIPLEIRRVRGTVSWGRDPFLSPLIKEEPGNGIKPGALILTGIVRDAKEAQAIIGDYIVNVGDIINGKEVISIRKNEVVLMEGKEKEILKLEEE
ncbi:hypothetical protein L6304_07195 [bacterium]|nr:hypothetical protein [bacterium]MCG2676931.1 hypothetical protein [bacterium]